MMSFYLPDGHKICVPVWIIRGFGEVRPSKTTMLHVWGAPSIEVQGDIVDLSVQFENRLKTILNYIGEGIGLYGTTPRK